MSDSSTVVVSVVLSADEIPSDSPDLIVFPEGISSNEIYTAAAHHHRAVIVGAVEEDGYMHSVLLHGGLNRIDYRKIGYDGRTKRLGDESQPTPVYEFGELCIGVLICMDVDLGAFRQNTVDRIKSSACPWKLAFIPLESHTPTVARVPRGA